MAKLKTWLESKIDEFKDDPEYLREYIKLLEEEINALKSQPPTAKRAMDAREYVLNMTRKEGSIMKDRLKFSSLLGRFERAIRSRNEYECDNVRKEVKEFTNEYFPKEKGKE